MKANCPMQFDGIDHVVLHMANREGRSYQRLHFTWSPIGLGLVESDPPEPEGFRALGLKVDNSQAV